MCRPSCAVACCTVLFLVIVARYAWAEQNPYLPKNISVASIQALPVQPTGRPILLTVVLGNTSDKPAYYWVGPTPYPTVTGVRATITDARGKVRTTLLYNSNNAGGSGGDRPLAPGETLDVPALILPLPTGSYTIRVDDGKPASVTVKEDPESARRQALTMMDKALRKDTFALYVLSKFPSDAVNESLLKDLLADDSDLVNRAAYVLDRIPNLPKTAGAVVLKAMRKQLILIGKDRNRDAYPLNALSYLASQIGDDEALKAVLEFARSDMVGSTAADVLGVFEQPEATEALWGLLKSPDETIRFSAARSLAKQSHPDALPILLEVANSASQWQPYALGELENYPNNPKVIEVLKENVHDKDSFVRSQARLALLHLAYRAKPGAGRPEFASWVGGFDGPGRLLGDPAVQKDLALNPEQVKKITTIVQQTMKDFHSQLNAFTAEEREEKMLPMQEGLHQAQMKALDQILTADPWKRLREINLQVQWPGFHLPEVQDRLALTPAQEKGLAQIERKTRKELNVLSNGPLLPPEEVEEQSKALRQRRKEQILAALTDRQKQVWRELTGRPFTPLRGK
jgi:HEAT repeat protein